MDDVRHVKVVRGVWQSRDSERLCDVTGNR